jgi:hypothetical protein
MLYVWYWYGMIHWDIDLWNICECDSNEMLELDVSTI